jgi:hypothetical protein
MTDAVEMRIVFLSSFAKLRKLLSTKFGLRLILMWPFGETNGAAMCTLKTQPMPNRQEEHPPA